MKLYIVTRNSHSDITRFGLYTDPSVALWRFCGAIAEKYENTAHWFLHFIGQYVVQVYETLSDSPIGVPDDAVQTELLEDVLLPTGYVRYRDDGDLITLPTEYLKINPDVKWLDEWAVSD